MAEADRLDLELGQALRQARRARDMSQSDLGEAVGVSFQQIQKYERGANRISFSMLLRLADALGCSLRELASEVHGVGVGEVADTLVPPEAPAVLQALAQIKSAGVRQAIVDFARALARTA